MYFAPKYTYFKKQNKNKTTTTKRILSLKHSRTFKENPEETEIIPQEVHVRALLFKISLWPLSRVTYQSKISITTKNILRIRLGKVKTSRGHPVKDNGWLLLLVMNEYRYGTGLDAMNNKKAGQNAKRLLSDSRTIGRAELWLCKKETTR